MKLILVILYAKSFGVLLWRWILLWLCEEGPCCASEDWSPVKTLEIFREMDFLAGKNGWSG